jgi:hypothetical protein
MNKELQEQLKKLLKCSDKNCQEGHYPLGMNEDGEIEWGGCPNCVVGSDYLPRVDPYKLKSFIDQNFIGREEIDELKRYVRKGKPICNWCGKPATMQTVKGEGNLKSGGISANDGWYCDDCYKKCLKIEEEAMYGN